MARDGGVLRRLQEAAEEATGLTLTRGDRLALLEATERDYRAQSRELDLLGWQVLDYFGGNPQEVTPQSRRAMAQKARTVWMDDPLVGSAVDLMNDFVFGRGVPQPRAKDEEIQKIVDEAWMDADNQAVLTSYEAQLALGTDLMIQSNLFLLMFDDGKDGRVKLALLNHDEVEAAVRDPDNRLRVLYYVAGHVRQEWDYENDKPKPVTPDVKKKLTYYEHWRNVQDALDRDEKPPLAPKGKVGDGKVYHVAVNRTSEMVFGVPTFRRVTRWAAAYNSFMSARVDMASAAAAFIMRRKIKGTPNQVAKTAAKAISRQSELAGVTGTGDSYPQLPPRGGSILTENESVQHEPMSLNANSAAAAEDARQIRAQLSAAFRLPQSYLGDQGASSLATAQSMELPVMKMVESRQEVFEGVFRWFIDRVIARAVEDGRIERFREMTDEEKAEAAKEAEAKAKAEGQSADTGPFGPQQLQQARALAPQWDDDQEPPEGMKERDLGYEFSMPSPLRRMMTDLVNSVANIAKTFDPNGTNLELSRTLLTIALGEGMEMQDPADAVARIFPPGYEDPLLAAQNAQAPQGDTGTGPFGPPADGGYAGQDGQASESNPYSVPGYGDAGGNGAQDIQQSVLEERRIEEQPPQAQAALRGVQDEIAQMWQDEIASVVGEQLARLAVNGAGAPNGRPAP